MMNSLAQTLSPANIAYSSHHSSTLTHNHSYYRSRAYSSHSGHNQLITAATPLFTLIMALRYTQTAANAQPLHQHFVHEIKAFESAALAQGYSSEFIIVARYLLCAALDETMHNTQWGQPQQWHKQTLLVTFKQVSSANERFLSLVDHMRADPKHYLDILEMMYLCLSLGFDGHFPQQPDSKRSFEQLINDIYTLICRQRGRISKRLSVCQHIHKRVPISKTRGIPWWKTLIAGSVLTGLLYVTLSYTAFTMTKPLAHTLQQLTTVQTDNVHY